MFGKKSSSLTEQDVLNALRGVQDPDLHRDLVDLGMIKNILIGEGTVALTVNLTTPACPMKAKIEADVRGALANRLGSDWAVTITMGAEVRGKGIAEKGDIPGVKNVIAVGSGKGGVGKSTMAAAIAYGLQAYGSTVGLMDADVYGPSIPHLVGATGRPMAKGERIQPIEANGLRLMSMGFLLEPERAVIMRGPMLHGIMQQFLHQVDWGDLDYLVIDLPPGTGDVPLTLSQALPLTGAVVVCTPQEVALLDATRAVAMFRQLKVPMLGMIENMSFFDVQSYLLERGGPKARKLVETSGLFEAPGDERAYLFGRGGARKKAEQLGVPFLGEVPLNINVRERGDEGKIKEALAPGSLARPYLLGVVEQLAAQISIQNIKTPKMPKLEILN
ncbi:Mrp/NBP35 family ATP-binding protein [Singulisphaera acidiphila]|uniref:Iron-sulfur cluster carrier protein n=1 Tax=Singulisphaera acidiphila (strain ATCC BAA-1392 / DSM 18658 / VKM B-2454 / MOB10) TaxID=886293 RepID=L0DG14_SINAD|nr:Mrp/NBP35 family ATP-binding protein [Singulisphaera acidiphila]AGA27790.1 ATPase involved in chromosome partitioning [Singulisphaera acidiphila DSM 18658]